MIYKIGEKHSEIIFTNNIKDMIANKILIVDENTKRYFDLSEEKTFFIKATEKNKNLDTVKSLYEFFYKNNVNRSTVVFAIGGGITLDIAGFAVSTFKRGCVLNFIPTTLLAMVDAAIGGKTAVNFNNVKNLIGTFYPAEKIYYNLSFLETLKSNDIINGKAEILKTALIQDNGLLDNTLLDDGIPDKDIILKTAKTKLEICQIDPYDIKTRRYLNFGHTFAHILESLSDYKISHGFGVLFGILAASYLSLKLRYLSPDDFDIILAKLKHFDFSFVYEFENKLKNIPDKLILNDKKNSSHINLILLKSLYKPFIYKTNKISLINNIIIDTIHLIKKF